MWHKTNAVFHNPDEAQKAVDHLKAEGYHGEHISVAMLDRAKEREFAAKNHLRSYALQINHLPQDVRTAAVALALLGAIFGIYTALTIHLTPVHGRGSRLSHAGPTISHAGLLAFTAGFQLWDWFMVGGVLALVAAFFLYSTAAKDAEEHLHAEQVSIGVSSRRPERIEKAAGILQEAEGHPEPAKLNQDLRQKRDELTGQLFSHYRARFTQTELALELNRPTYSAGQTPGRGLYHCTSCNFPMAVDDDHSLQVCGKCGNTTFST